MEISKWDQESSNCFMNTLNGIAASSDIAIAKAYCLAEPELIFHVKTIKDSVQEIRRFRTAVEKVKQELERIYEQTKIKLGEDKAAIIDAHLMVLSDPDLVNAIENTIKTEKVNVEYAVQNIADKFISLFEQMNSEYMRERAADIRDVAKRVLSHLTGVELVDLSTISEEVIIVAKDLAPSHAAQLNSLFVKGFTTDIGGKTSHTAIMARTLEIPAVVGTKTATEKINHGDLLIVDGTSGEVIINPDQRVVVQYEKKREEIKAQKAAWAKLVNEKTISADGHRVTLAANIGTPADVKSVIHHGGEGIGLYRTEFLYMGREQFPTEDEQYVAYKKVLQEMKEKPVVVRTLDIGGDKKLPYLKLPEEMNPFLGLRAIRLSFEKEELFRTQLRALLRASTVGNLKIMFPMIATLDEFRHAKAIFIEEKEKLSVEDIAFSESIELGVMVEIPSTAILADQFAKEVDFFSIGTNDLIQYTMAADRTNEQVSYLYQPYSPSILRLVKMVIDAAHEEGKWVGMCGEMAGDEMAIPVLLGLGLDEFSMSATSILKARSLIKGLNKSEMKTLAQKVLTMSTTEEVQSAIKAAIKQ